MKYYFLCSTLKPLSLGVKAELGLESFFHLCKLNVTESDYRALEVLRTWVDIQNIRYFLENQPLLEHGHFNREEMGRAIEEKRDFPKWVIDYLESYSETGERLLHFPELLMQTYIEWSQREGFWGRYMAFERDLMLILAGYRAKRLKWDLNRVLSFEEKDHPIASFLFANRESPHFEPPYGYEDLTAVLAACADQPLKQQELIAGFRLKRIGELIQDELFTIDWLQGYGLMLSILEEQEGIATARGEEIIERILA